MSTVPSLPPSARYCRPNAPTHRPLLEALPPMRAPRAEWADDDPRWDKPVGYSHAATILTILERVG